MFKFRILAIFAVAGLLAGVSGMPVSAKAQPFQAPTGLVSDLFGLGDGTKEDLELKDAINYDQCFDYSESMSITLSHKCMFSKMPPIPAPVFKYKAEHREPTAIVELTMEPGGGALKREKSLGNIVGQGAMGAVSGGVEGAVAGAAAGVFGANRTKGSPTTLSHVGGGVTRKAYFDAHVWGVGPLGLLEAGKGGVEEQGGGRMNALKSMTCWLADASEYWTPVPFKASAHLGVIAPAADPYLRYYLGDWGTRWYNKAGSAQVSATSAKKYSSGFGDNAAFGLAAMGAMVGYAMASDDEGEKCQAKRSVDQARSKAGGVRQTAEVNQDKVKELAPRGTYLPAGYEQINAGYDTCPLTGVGHYVDEQTGQLGFNNCDPQERIIQMDCSTGQGRFVAAAPGPVTTTMDPYQNPCAGGGKTFADDPYVYVRAPSCHNRLSGYQEDGKYLACNSNSVSYASCGYSLSGTARMVPGHGSGAAGNKAGPFSLCLQPRGQKVVNHLDEFNESLGQGVTQAAEDYQRGVEAAGGALDEHLEEQQIECSDSGGGNGLMGAAVGGAAGFAAGSLLDGQGGGLPGGDLAGKAGEYFSDVKGKISGSIKGSAFGQKFNDIAGGMQDKFDSVKGGVTGRLGDITQGAGLGSLSSATSKIGAAVAFDGSLASMGNLAEAMGVMPEWLSGAAAMFNQDKIIPLYLSEQNQQDWRSENPATKMARMNLMQNVPLAGTATNFARNLANVNCGDVGVWGQLCPMRGFVETSGNSFPASGLAGWRAYHKALPKIPDRKRMKGKATVFNLDYPHQSACHPIGENPVKWESRSEQGGGILGKLFGGESKGLQGLFNKNNAGAGLGSIFGSPSDKRLETGTFVYTYWKDTKCTWDVCTSPNAGIGLSDLANVPGLEALQGVSGKLNSFKQNLPGMDALQNMDSLQALQNMPGANMVGGFASDWAQNNIPGGDYLWGGGGSAAGSEGAGDGDCRPPMLCASEGGGPPAPDGSPFVPDYLGGSGEGGLTPPDSLNGSLSALESLPGAESLTNMMSSMSPASLPSLGNLGKILDFESIE